MERERGSVVAAMLQLLQTHELSPRGPTAELQTHELIEQHTVHELSPHSKHNPLLQNVDSQLLSPSMHTGLINQWFMSTHAAVHIACFIH